MRVCLCVRARRAIAGGIQLFASCPSVLVAESFRLLGPNIVSGMMCVRLCVMGCMCLVVCLVGCSYGAVTLVLEAVTPIACKFTGPCNFLH